MAKEQERQKLQKLLDDIDTFKREGIDHQHPKFQEWKRAARAALKAIYGEGSPVLAQFKELNSRRKEDRMWEEEHDIRGKGKAVFKVDLERARTILEEALKVSHLLGEDGKEIGEEEFISTVSKGTIQEEATPSVGPVQPQAPPQTSQEASPTMSIEKLRELKPEKDIEGLLHELEQDKKNLERVQTTFEEALEGVSLGTEEVRVEELLQQLEEQINDPDVEMRRVQKTMEELLKLKGKKALLQRLAQETKDPRVPWGKIKGLMKGVWEIDRKFLVNILPDLLED